SGKFPEEKGFYFFLDLNSADTKAFRFATLQNIGDALSRMRDRSMQRPQNCRIRWMLVQWRKMETPLTSNAW
ncbi:hypothetical protein C5167_047718, partial [Papaver somniferum]